MTQDVSRAIHYFLRVSSDFSVPRGFISSFVNVHFIFQPLRFRLTIESILHISIFRRPSASHISSLPVVFGFALSKFFSISFSLSDFLTIHRILLVSLLRIYSLCSFPCFISALVSIGVIFSIFTLSFFLFQSSPMYFISLSLSFFPFLFSTLTFPARFYISAPFSSFSSFSSFPESVHPGFRFILVLLSLKFTGVPSRWLR